MSECAVAARTPPPPLVCPLLRREHGGGGAGAVAGNGGGGGGGGIEGAGRRRSRAVGPRPRHIVQLLALLLAASGYCMLLASSALAPAETPPTPPPQTRRSAPTAVLTLASPAADAYGALSQHRPVHGLGVLPRPDDAGPGMDYDDLEQGVDPEALEAELEERRRRVWRVCKERGLDREGQPNAWEFFIDPRHSLVWCNVFKAASTSWLYNFFILAGHKPQTLEGRKSPLAQARKNFPRPTLSQLNAALPESLSFLIVREPFERLLSAYRNKLEGMRSVFYWKLGREIAARPLRGPTAAPRPEASTAAPAPVAANKRRPPKGPTFQQFVDHVIAVGLKSKKPHFDEHWAPYYRFCTPCLVNFTVIAKTETLARDDQYIIHRAGLESALQPLLKYRNLPRMRNQARGAIPTSKYINEYFSTLTRSQLDDLMRIYGADFELFGYNASKYYSLVKPGR